MKKKRLYGSTTPRHDNSKALILYASMTLLPMLLTSCHKTCTCLTYNGGAHTYTAEEVDERGVTCPNMIFQAGVQYYSVCNWD